MQQQYRGTTSHRRILAWSGVDLPVFEQWVTLVVRVGVANGIPGFALPTRVFFSWASSKYNRFIKAVDSSGSQNTECAYYSISNTLVIP